MVINYMAEINARAAYKPIIATPADHISRQFNLYYIDLFKPDRDTYWTRWGGRYDTLQTSRVEIYITQWLQRASNLQDVLATPYLYYIDSGEQRLYFNCPRHPWLYHSYELQLVKIQGFLHSVKNPDNPSDCYIGGDYLPVLLEKPSDDRKLSSPLNGAELYLTFSIKIKNNGGFDLISPDEYFNGPARLYKSVAENPGYEDFFMIRTGTVENVSADDKSVTFNCAEQFRSLEQSVCKTITKDDFDIEEDGVEGAALPLVFGSTEVKLIKISEPAEDAPEDAPVRFLAAEYISSVTGVYDKDGAAVPYTRDGLVIISEGSAEYAKITGYAENRIGYIVTRIISERASIPYIATYWDTAETNAYLSVSPRINIVIESGTVKSAVNEIIKSDMVFLIQKNNALFTLRRWGVEYGVHKIDSWLLTQQPKINWNDAQKNFFSSCVIFYKRNGRTKEYDGSYLNTESEEAAEELYNKKKRAEFQTHLVNEADAKALSVKLAGRFCRLKAQAALGVGADTSAINLLDTVLITLNVNGRVYSNTERWVAVGINPAQDTMTLAEE